ncbi:MAG: zinc ABC transporter solute-binding protein [Chloroflexaceae bacterium]|nr:zinc ABC transporter solute-binding protein [Chloroflexaceae bacterium]
MLTSLLHSQAKKVYWLNIVTSSSNTSSLSASARFNRLTMILAASFSFGVSSCRLTPTPSSPSETPIAPQELQVVTTFLPITQFTRAVAGDRAEVVQLLPPNTSPHDYQAKPIEAQAIATADVLVKNGLGMEVFLEDLVANAGNADLVVIDSSDGIATLSSEEVEGQNHEHDHAHDHDHETKAESHHHGEHNPHIWLDPKRAIQQVENIRDGLIEADSAGESEYTANAAAYIAQLQALDAEIAARLAPYAGKTFVAFHDFAPYFADSYGLEAEFLVDVPEENASPEDVRRVIETVQASNLKTLLTEPQVGEATFAALAADLNVQVSVFDPLETGDAAATNPQYYLTTMRLNLDSLEAAFQGSTQSWLFPWWSPDRATWSLLGKLG